jgi:hypothetical protein
MMYGAVPNLSAILQGEMVRTEKGLEGYFCERATMTVADLETLAKNGYPTGLPPMRWTMAAGYHQPMGYLQTMMALRRCLDPASFEDVMLLLQWYPEAAIELAAFSCPVGVLPRRNTIIWEVRDY